MSSREEQKQQRRDQILTIALDEFISKGFYGTSTREIAKKAGISSGLMFHYFSSKEALYEALMELGCRKVDLDMEEALRNPLGYMKRMVEKIYEMLKGSTFFARMFVFVNKAYYSAYVSERVNELIENSDGLVSVMIPLIIKGQELEQIKSGNPRTLSVAFFSCIQGIAQAYAYNPEEELPDVEWLLDIVRK